MNKQVNTKMDGWMDGWLKVKIFQIILSNCLANNAFIVPFLKIII